MMSDVEIFKTRGRVGQSATTKADDVLMQPQASPHKHIHVPFSLFDRNCEGGTASTAVFLVVDSLGTFLGRSAAAPSSVFFLDPFVLRSYSFSLGTFHC